MKPTVTQRVVLESGDRLTQAEFHRRYCSRPDIKKAELVQGVVYVPSPLSAFHAEPHAWTMMWLGAYLAKHTGLRLADNITLILDETTEVQPDACLWREGPDGAAQIGGDGYLHGAPELVVEIAASSAAYDLFDKKESYRRSGVREYIVWQTLESLIDWFRLQDSAYVRVEPNDDAIVESREFPNRLAVPRMVQGDLAGVLDVLNW